MVRMKSRILALIVIAGAWAAASGLQKPADQEKKDPLEFVKVAADVAGNVQPETVKGTLAVYVSEENWAAGLKDGDLGPFLKVKSAKSGRSAVLFFNEKKDAAVCVFFDGDTPFAVAPVKAGSTGVIKDSDVAAALKPIAKEMLKKGSEELTFTRGDVTTDAGDPLPAYAVAAANKFKT